MGKIPREIELSTAPFNDVSRREIHLKKLYELSLLGHAHENFIVVSKNVFSEVV